MSYTEPHPQAREWDSVVQHVLSMLQILGSIPIPKREEKQEEEGKVERGERKGKRRLPSPIKDRVFTYGICTD